MSHALSQPAAASTHAGKALVMNRNDAPPPAATHGPGVRPLPSDEELREISASLRGLRYGSVNIVVQDGVIIQIDRVEKRRLRTREVREGNRS
jgi:hypothetical protein